MNKLFVSTSLLILIAIALLGLAACDKAPLPVSPSQTPRPLDPEDATAPSETWPTLTAPPSQTAEPLDPDDPTAPSETWPTLTAPPTLTPEPTRPRPSGPTRTPRPSPTHPSPELTPVPEGKIPADVQSILYVAEGSSLDMGLRQALIDASGQRWGSQRLYGERGLTAAAGQNPDLVRARPSGDMYLSPKFDYLAVNSGHHYFTIVNLVTGVIERQEGSYFWSWTPDGRGYVYFAEQDANGKYDMSGHAFVGSLDNSERQELDLPRGITGLLDARDVSFLSDGKTLIYISSGAVNEIWTWNTMDGDRKLIAQQKSYFGEISISPDGKTIAYISLVRPANPQAGDLVVVSIETGRTWRWDSGAVAGIEHGMLAWSPTSDQLAFLVQSSDCSDDLTLPCGISVQENNLYVMNTSNGVVTPITSFSGRVITALTFSPDGKRIAFNLMPAITNMATPLPEWAEIWVAELATKNIYPIASDGKGYTSLVWLPAALQP